MLKRRILVIDDDLSFCRSIRETMQDDYTDVCYTMSVEETLDAFAAYDYCLVVLNLRLSEADGTKVLHMIRQTKTMPILVLAEQLKEPEKLTLFQMGANVVLEKPIDMSVCVAQANSLIQLYMEQTGNQSYHPLIFGTELMIDPTYRQVVVNGEQLALTRKEFDLLLCLARHPGRVWTRTQLYSQVWSDDLGLSGENAVKAHIRNLRKKLADMGRDYIQTLWGVGYKFVPPAANASPFEMLGPVE